MWWAGAALDISSRLQSHNAIGQAGLLIGRQNIVRVDPTLKTDIAMDDYQQSLIRLVPQAELEFQHWRADLEHFFTDQVEPYTRCYE